MTTIKHDDASGAPVERPVIHIHAPKATAKRALKMTCPDCKKRTRMLEFFTPWYGWHSTCLKCGREWADCEWLPLEFSRGVRSRNIETAKAIWRKMPPISHNHFWLDV
jgi:hypothetical protein